MDEAADWSMSRSSGSVFIAASSAPIPASEAGSAAGGGGSTPSEMRERSSSGMAALLSSSLRVGVDTLGCVDCSAAAASSVSEARLSLAWAVSPVISS